MVVSDNTTTNNKGYEEEGFLNHLKEKKRSQDELRTNSELQLAAPDQVELKISNDK